MSVDPLTKEYPELTPYQFASNTPIQAIDLDGLESVSYTITLDHEVYETADDAPWKRYIPFMNTRKTRIIGASVSEVDIKSQANLAFRVLLKVPIVPTRNPNATYYHIYTYEGNNLGGLSDPRNYKKYNKYPLADAFVNGFEIGVYTGIVEPLLDQATDKALRFIVPRLGANAILRRGLQLAGFNKGDNYPGLFKQFRRKFSEGEYDFEVRIHGPDANAPIGSNSREGMTARVQRRKQGRNEQGQGYGWEYGDGNGNWFSNKELRQYNKDGSLNPDYNAKAANDVHIPIDQLRIE